MDRIGLVTGDREYSRGGRGRCRQVYSSDARCGNAPARSGAHDPNAHPFPPVSSRPTTSRTLGPSARYVNETRRPIPTRYCAPVGNGPSGDRPARGTSLGRTVAEGLRARIVAGEFPPGARLPSETQLAASYNVSRVTIRTAIKLLESQGLVDPRHGLGTFVNDFGGGIRTGLQELRSITDTIAEMGMRPSMERHRMEIRAATEIEADRLALPAKALVVAIERAVLADADIVAYSYDAVPRDVVGGVEDLGNESVFAALREAGHDPVRALAEVHAVVSNDVAWGSQRPSSGLYLLLDQVHFDRSGQRLMYSRTYFVEGRFQFMILRTR